jgi:D-alanyl-D-alanine carboxypeptidase (penicillin-binding protein 5/6)
MPDRFIPRAALAVAAAALAAAAVGAPAAVAATGVAGDTATVAAAGTATASASGTGEPQTIGGARLSGRGVIVDYGSSGARKLPDVKASAFVIADADTGQVLAAKDPHGWYRPASTLKMLTAVSLIPLLNPNATVVASKQATSVSPNVVGLISGHAYKISDLFTALLTISANDAAVALAQAAGSFGKGMAVINAEARHLRADDTVAVEPNGLPATGQHTSAYDMALIARQALRLPAFLKYDQTITATFPVSKKKSVSLYNQNSLLTSYRGAIGGKIGWTTAAGATYVGMARRNGVTLIVTLLHCPALTEIDSAKSLLNWGFAADGKVAPVGTLVSALHSAAPAPVRSAAAGSVDRRAATRPQAAAGGVDGRAAARPQATASGPSTLTTAGYSGVGILAAGLGFAYTRRQRSRA